MISATLINRAWRRIDMKLSIGGDMHVLSWRRGWFHDEVTFDGRRVASTSGFFARDTLYGFVLRDDNDDDFRLLLSVDPESDWWDWSCEMRPRGVRLETADAPLIAFGSLGPDPASRFTDLFDRAVKSLGLS